MLSLCQNPLNHKTGIDKFQRHIGCRTYFLPGFWDSLLARPVSGLTILAFGENPGHHLNLKLHEDPFDAENKPVEGDLYVGNNDRFWFPSAYHEVGNYENDQISASYQVDHHVMAPQSPIGHPIAKLIHL